MQIRNSQSPSDETPLHSHSFVRDDSTTIGSTNPESYDVRKLRERNRIFVAGYKRSIIGQPVVARKYQRPIERSSKHSSKANSRQQQSVTPPSPIAKPPELRFHEPPARKFNPYG